MKVVFHHPHPLPVIAYGGIERIIFWHMVELVRMGLQVVLIGHADSKVTEHGIQLIPHSNQEQNWEELIPSDADIIHLFYNHQCKTKIQTINTIQGNGKIGEKFILNSVFVSKKHAENHGSKSFVYNALNLNEYPFVETKKEWNRFLFLAKASWRVKNLKHAVSACRAAGKHLEIVGGRWIGLSRYIHSHGIIGGETKMNLINKSDALIFPVRWHEPFGIAIIEAMSLGLPVIGSPYGSLPELITPETGIIVKNHEELTEVLKNPTRKFDSMVIRKYIEENFCMNKHASAYLALYQKVIKGENLNLDNPSYNLVERAENLLPF
jgi:glycosyltransferase involved in cell wall biosynthesis